MPSHRITPRTDPEMRALNVVAPYQPTESIPLPKPEPRQPSEWPYHLVELTPFACIATAAVAFWSTYMTDPAHLIAGSAGLLSFLLDAVFLARLASKERNR